MNRQEFDDLLLLLRAHTYQWAVSDSAPPRRRMREDHARLMAEYDRLDKELEVHKYLLSLVPAGRLSEDELREDPMSAGG